MKPALFLKIFKRMMLNLLVEFAVPLAMISLVGLIVLCLIYPWLVVLLIIGAIGCTFYVFWKDAEMEVLHEEWEKGNG